MGKVSMPSSEHASVSIRKIDNGYIVCRTTSGPKGYSSTETYSATKPKLDVPEVSEPKRMSPLQRAAAAGSKRVTSY